MHCSRLWVIWCRFIDAGNRLQWLNRAKNLIHKMGRWWIAFQAKLPLPVKDSWAGQLHSCQPIKMQRPPSNMCSERNIMAEGKNPPSLLFVGRAGFGLVVVQNSQKEQLAGTVVPAQFDSVLSAWLIIFVQNCELCGCKNTSGRKRFRSFVWKKPIRMPVTLFIQKTELWGETTSKMLS